MSFARIAAAMLVALCLPAHAVNKCTMADGQVVYQDAPCTNAARTQETLKTWDNSIGPNGAAGEWEFVRIEDPLTSHIVCGARSPVVYADINRQGLRHTDMPQARAVLVVVGDKASIGFSSIDSPSMHNDRSGTGVKIDPGKFFSTAGGLSSNSVSVSDGAQEELIAQMSKGNSLRLRLRFWPYQNLYDMAPMPLAGFAAALTRARQCAAAVAVR